jgi:hypothetical protein
MLLEACDWLKSTWLSTLIRESKWGFATVEMGHLVSLALLGGALLTLALRVFGTILEDQPLAATARDLQRLLGIAFLGLLTTGMLLFADGPLRYYGNGAFRVKLLLIGAAVLFGWRTLSYARRFQDVTVLPIEMKFTTAASLTLFLGAAVAGRVIGVL